LISIPYSRKIVAAVFISSSLGGRAKKVQPSRKLDLADVHKSAQPSALTGSKSLGVGTANEPVTTPVIRQSALINFKAIFPEDCGGCVHFLVTGRRGGERVQPGNPH
jgi:hypothetical protein